MSLTNLKVNLRILFTLVRRDYAVQFAGSLLGIFWAFLQSVFIILLYGVIFFFLDPNQEVKTHILRILSGLLFWLPLQEMLIRSVSILSENRNLIKKSNIGSEIFLWIPFIQMLIHYFFLSIPVFALFIYLGHFTLLGMILSYFWIFISGILLYFVSNYLARVNILLKDLTPLIRLIAQILFWSLPILYTSNLSLKKINLINPFYSLLNFHKMILGFENLNLEILYYLLYPFLLSFLLFYLSRKKLSKLIWDHL